MTAQAAENLIVDGVEYQMTFCPPLPYGHARLHELSNEEMRTRQQEARQRPTAAGDSVISELDLITGSTGCWRRYRGTWEIRDGKFYLVAIIGRYELAGDGPLLADWFTGVLRVPRGRQLQYVHMGFGSVYEEEIHIHAERGRVTRTRILDNRGKTFDEDELALANLPGGENRFAGDRDFD